MERSEVIQGFLDLYDAPNYLEIGVENGVTFHALNAGRKTAVDPAFLFDVTAAQAANPNATYHSMPSDQYFSQSIKPTERFDVIFIDGLHTFEQTLRDLLNALQHVKPNGVIILDDVMPVNYMSSLPTLAKSKAFQQARGIHDAAWMGDVFRLVYFIRDYLRQLSYATTVENHGLSVLWAEPRPTPDMPLDMNEIMRLDYSDLVLDPSAFNRRPFAEIVAEVRAAIGVHG